MMWFVLFPLLLVIFLTLAIYAFRRYRLVDIKEQSQYADRLKETNEELRKHERRLLEALSKLERANHLLKSTQTQLIQAEKMHSIGQMAAGVAHEVLNPLAIVNSGIEYISKNMIPSSPEVSSVVQDVREAVKRAHVVLREMLDFASPHRPELAKVDLNAIIDQPLTLLKHELEKCRIRLTRDLDKSLPPLELDRNRIQQVFLNLFTNAIHAMPQGGHLTVRTYERKLTQARKEIGRTGHDRFRVGERAVVTEVEDTGEGVKEEHMHRIFDPFFTTKRVGKGTGLGLPVARGIMDQHGGLIWVENRSEGGVRVLLWFKV